VAAHPEELSSSMPRIESDIAAMSYDTVRYLLQVKDVPTDLKESFWVWIQPLPALSNLRYIDVNRVLEGFMLDAKLAIHQMRMKKQKITIKLLRWVNQAFFCLFMMAMRSVGPERERKLLATSIKETKSRLEEELRTPKKGRLGG